MEVVKTNIRDVYLINPHKYLDKRGYFSEIYSKKELACYGLIADFIQDNESFTACKGTIRGLHFQKAPFGQTKLVRVIKGAVLDVVVDLRIGSPDYGKWISVELNEENGRMLWIPKGFAHGFQTLSDNVIFNYKVDSVYAPEYERIINYKDPTINIRWKLENIILSDKDRVAPMLAEVDNNFKYL